MPKRSIKAVVISDKMEKTVVVSVENFKVHPLYQKRVRRNKKYKAHNEIKAKIGDLVLIEESRPLSKEKHWSVVKILN